MAEANVCEKAPGAYLERSGANPATIVITTAVFPSPSEVEPTIEGISKGSSSWTFAIALSPCISCACSASPAIEAGIVRV